LTGRLDMRRLGPADAATLTGFLARHAAGSMFLRGNLQAAGLDYGGRPHEGVYVGGFDAEALVGVAAHYWNGNIVLQAPEHAGALACAVVAASGRPVHGLLGPRAQVVAARRALDAERRPATMDSDEVLFGLALSELRVPPPLADGALACRRSRDDDLAQLTEWRMAYAAEALGVPDTPSTRARESSTVERAHRAGALFVLEASGVAVALCQFNASTTDTVQIGGVWTPTDLRRRGYAQAVVAGALLAARATGRHTAILFTDQDNVAARRAYVKLGFAPIGDYGIVLFQDT
jgi:RimJ/RimL family protein N-acetyltransferase